MITYINLFENTSTPGKGERIGAILGLGSGMLSGGLLGSGIYRTLTTGEDPIIQIDPANNYTNNIWSMNSGMAPGGVLGAIIGGKLGKKIDKNKTK